MIRTDSYEIVGFLDRIGVGLHVDFHELSQELDGSALVRFSVIRTMENYACPLAICL